MTAASGNGQEGVSEDKQYLVPREISPRGREVLFRPASKAHAVEDGTAADFLSSATKGGGAVAGAPSAPPPPVWQQAGAALFYAVASLVVIFVNKVWLCVLGRASTLVYITYIRCALTSQQAVSKSVFLIIPARALLSRLLTLLYCILTAPPAPPADSGARTGKIRKVQSRLENVHSGKRVLVMPIQQSA